MHFGSLLPDPVGLGWSHVQVVNEEIRIELHTTVPARACPLCGRMSGRIHSRYTRMLGDLPWHGRSVHLVLSVRRFFCDYTSCQRRIFAERISCVAAAYARRTRRLDEALSGIAFACGGEAGARLAHRLGMSTSPDTLLRRIRRGTVPESQRLRAVGIDDWAVRRGQRYGTIVCDLERHRPVDVLADRESKTVANWLSHHPEIEVITRDRAGFYIDGASTGAPQAMQVADRFHLMQNLREALHRLLDRRHKHLLAVAREVAQARASCVAAPALAENSRAPPQRRIPRHPSVNEIRRLRRVERYEQVVALHAQGISQRAIAKRMGINRGTVAKYLHAGMLPERAARVYASKTDPHVDFLRKRWAEGCHNAAQLARELAAQGFRGSYCSVRRRVATWDRTTTNESTQALSTQVSYVRAPSARRLSWLLLKEPDDLGESECAFVDVLYRLHPEVNRAASLARSFAEMMRERRGEKLDVWIEQARQSDVPRELGVFATGLKSDYDAVKAALTTEWSNGQVEGQVNRLKLLKRQMYGRAKFDLLRQRVLHAQ